MLIVCPACASRYELDGAKLGSDGRKVRCATCQTLWHVIPEPELSEVPTAAETQALLNEELAQAAAIEAQVSALTAERGDEAGEDLFDAPPPPRRGRRAARKPSRKAGSRASRPPGKVVAIAAMLSVAGLALFGVLLWQRDRAVRASPQLAVVFEALGIPVNARGLQLSAVESGLIDDAGGRFLVVEGDVINITSGSAKVPPIEVAVKDAAGQTLYSWKTEPPRSELEPSELMRFRARLAAPPAAGQSVQVRFAASGHGGAAAVR